MSQDAKVHDPTAAFAYQQVAKSLLERSGKNMVVVAPTGAGKTRVGEMALELAGSGAYVAPTRALCWEKFHWLQEHFPKAKVVLGNKDYSLSGSRFAGADLRVITPWRLNALIQSRPDLPKICPVIVLDELQNQVCDPDLEMLITKLLAVFDGKIQIVGLSSAIHEEDRPKITAWLDAIPVVSDKRPVPLMERVAHFSPEFDDYGEEYTQATIWEQGRQIDQFEVPGQLPGSHDATVATARYIREHVDDAPALVYTPYQMRARHLASLLVELQQDLGVQPDPELEERAEGLPDDAGEYTADLKAALPYGVGIHHGSMTALERETVHELAEAGKLQYVATCLTLAHGVNLPARHIIMESVHEFDDTGRRRLMDISLYQNLSGRAGRPQFDQIGYVWIVSMTEVEKVEIEEVLLKYKASRIESRVYNEYFLTAQVPGLVLLGFNTAEKLAGFMQRTLWGRALQDLTPIAEQFEKIIIDLLDRNVIEILGDDFLVLTEKGNKIARFGLHPQEYEAIEALIAQENTSYEDWILSLARACRSYAAPDQDDERFAETVAKVVTYGLAVYGVKSHYRTKNIADYVGRLLEIARTLMKVSPPDSTYVEDWTYEVYERFAYGTLEMAKQLAPILDRSQLKRLVRNVGAGLEDFDPAVMNGSHPGVRAIAVTLWGHSPNVPIDQIQQVGEALSIPLEKLLNELVQYRLWAADKEGEEAIFDVA